MNTTPTPEQEAASLGFTMADAIGTIDELEAVIKTLRAESDGYRWIRERWCRGGGDETGLEPVMHVQTEAEFDAAIRAAIRAGQANKEDDTK